MARRFIFGSSLVLLAALGGAGHTNDFHAEVKTRAAKSAPGVYDATSDIAKSVAVQCRKVRLRTHSIYDVAFEAQDLSRATTEKQAAATLEKFKRKHNVTGSRLGKKACPIAAADMQQETLVGLLLR